LAKSLAIRVKNQGDLEQQQKEKKGGKGPVGRDEDTWGLGVGLIEKRRLETRGVPGMYRKKKHMFAQSNFKCPERKVCSGLTVRRQ